MIKATSEIIDGFLKGNYAFLELSVELRIQLGPKKSVKTGGSKMGGPGIEAAVEKRPPG